MGTDKEKLSAGVRLAYGAGELGPAMAGSTMIFFQMVFLTDVAGLNAAVAGSVLLVGKVWDAVSDPLIGWLGDHTRTPWGRRLPWIAASAIPFLLFFFLQWIVPPIRDQWGLFAFYAGIALLYNTCYTGVTLAHNALTPELTHDYDERSRLAGFRMAFSLLGSVGGLLLAVAIFPALKHLPKTTQWSAFAGAVALVGLVSLAICVAGIWRTARQRDIERIKEEIPSKPLGVRRQFAVIFANRPYLLVCGIYLFSWLAMQFTATVLPYYVQGCMRLPADAFRYLALCVQVTALLLIPAWGWLSVRIGKKAVYFCGMLFWLVGQAGLVVLKPGQTELMYGLGVLAGFGISVCYLIPNAMLPDTIELDELRSKRRREGVFYGFFVFLQKIALAVGTFVIGVALNAAGYLSAGPGQPDPVQPASALSAIRIAVGPLPAVAIVLGMVLAALYPITKARHHRILELLERRRAFVRHCRS